MKKEIYTTEQTRIAIDNLIQMMEINTEANKHHIATRLKIWFDDHYGNGIYGTGIYGDLYHKFQDMCDRTIPTILDSYFEDK
tara:strand:+ start:171 stop:416 length:246 start_codon:yes stop_codon:yes gene_type:complete